jgi:hypothetical protein
VAIHVTSRNASTTIITLTSNGDRVAQSGVFVTTVGVDAINVENTLARANS